MHAEPAAPRRHVGVLLPWANQAVEEELPQLGGPDVVFHYARLVPASRTTAVDAAFWHGLRAASATATESLRHLPLGQTLLACTSAGFSGGPELPPGVLTAFDALIATLTRRGLTRIVLATPYPDAVTRAEAAALAKRGVQVSAYTGLGLDDGYPDVSTARILTLFARLPESALAHSDALVLSCTGWRTLAAAGLLRERLGMPVITSNLALATHSPDHVTGAAP